VVCDERPHTIDRVTYPPADKVTKLGRLNRCGQPMFYGSRGAPVSPLPEGDFPLMLRKRTSVDHPAMSH
jgi:hypothetical protein